jgi:hypothetical protein
MTTSAGSTGDEIPAVGLNDGDALGRAVGDQQPPRGGRHVRQALDEVTMAARFDARSLITPVPPPNSTTCDPTGTSLSITS